MQQTTKNVVSITPTKDVTSPNKKSMGNTQQLNYGKEKLQNTTFKTDSWWQKANKTATSYKGKEPDRKARYSKKEEQVWRDTCYGCGQLGHIAKDLICPNNSLAKKQSVQLYAAREIIEEDSAEEQVLDKEHSESQNESQEEDLYFRSQYSSKGGYSNSKTS